MCVFYSLNVELTVELLLLEGFLVHLRILSFLVLHFLQFNFFGLPAFVFGLLLGLILKRCALLVIHPSEGQLEDACPGNLMIITGALGLDNVLVAGQGITIVHIAKLGNKLVHLDIVHILLIIK